MTDKLFSCDMCDKDANLIHCNRLKLDICENCCKDYCNVKRYVECAECDYLND